MKQTLLLFVTLILLLSGCNRDSGSDRLADAAPVEPPAQSSIPEPTQPPTEPEPTEPPSEPDPWDNAVTHTLDDREDYLTGEVVEIKERLFVAQTWDVYLNPEDYLNKTLKYEGFYVVYENELSGEQYHYLGRWGPGCCADDSIVGFEVLDTATLPEPGEWVKVTGHIEINDELGIIVLNVDSLEVLDTRGAETVTT